MFLFNGYELPLLPISAMFQSISKMGQSLKIKPQSLLDFLCLMHILDTLGHFISIVRAMQKIKAD